MIWGYPILKIHIEENNEKPALMFRLWQSDFDKQLSTSKPPNRTEKDIEAKNKVTDIVSEMRYNLTVNLFGGSI